VADATCFNKDMFLFKVDFEKGFDLVDWCYLEAVMKKNPTLWRKWIIECISTPSSSILVNGCPTDEFKIEWGLRQGNLPPRILISIFNCC